MIREILKDDLDGLLRLYMQLHNIRDYASINELICLSNMENINAVLVKAKCINT